MLRHQCWFNAHLSRNMRFPTIWYVWRAKAQISLRICAVWSESLLVAWIFYGSQATDWTSFVVSKLKEMLYLHLSKCPIVGNHMSRLIWHCVPSEMAYRSLIEITFFIKWVRCTRFLNMEFIFNPCHAEYFYSTVVECSTLKYSAWQGFICIL